MGINIKKRIAWNKGLKGTQVAWNKGKKLSKEHKLHLSESHKGQIPWFVKLGIKNINKGTFGYGRMPTLEDRRKASESLIAKYKNGFVSPHKGRIRTEESKRKISLAQIGHIPWNKGFKTGIKPWLNKKRPDIAGENCYNWKGGVTPKNLIIRNSLEMKLWKRSILGHDDFRCFDCGERGGKLEVDHILPYSKYPRLRFDLNNGQILCKNCHLQKTKLDKGLIAVYAATL